MSGESGGGFRVQGDSAEAELRDLRRAAEQGDWNGCCEAVERLLSRLSPERALELARQQLERRLPGFERHQPGVTWPRDVLDSLRAPDASGAGGRKWPWENDEFPGPGANSFIRGVDALWQARRLASNETRRIEVLLEAIQAAIKAEKNEAWGARHPELWAYWYESLGTGEADPKRGRIQDAMGQDPETVRLQREAWHEVADRLAEALGLAR